MRFSYAILFFTVLILAGCQTGPSKQEVPFERTTVAETVRIPPLEGRPRPRFQRITYSVSGEGTIYRVDLVLRESKERYDVFEVINYMPHGTSSRHWHGYAGLAHLLVTPKGIAPGANFQSQSQVIGVETWEGELFPLAVDNYLEVMMTNRDSLFHLRSGQTAQGENTCLFAFRVMEELENPPPFYDDIEGPFYLIRQTIECMEGEPVFREIVFAPSIGCPVEIRTFDMDENVLAYRRLQHIAPPEPKRSGPPPRRHPR